MTMSPGVLLVATMDTKGKEALYLEKCLKEAGVEVFILDAGIMGEGSCTAVVSREQVARAAGRELQEVQAAGHEGMALQVMIEGAVRCAQGLYSEGKILGIMGVGGSMGTALGTSVMRSFPIGLPKVMVSSVASRDTRHFVGTKDIVMLHSVCDISGLNRVTMEVLRNGALALAGMVKGGQRKFVSERPLAVVSAMGTCEPCAARVRAGLEAQGYEPVVFHTTGIGGQAMEEMLLNDGVSAVADLSLHELICYLFGGDNDAGPDRGKAALQREIPVVLVPGGFDFLVTGPVQQAEARYPGRRYHIHNPAITCVRADIKEIESAAHVLASLCNKAKGPSTILVPSKGLSSFDKEGGPLHDPQAPSLLAEMLKNELRKGYPLKLLPFHINDPEFADAVIENLRSLTTDGS